MFFCTYVATFVTMEKWGSYITATIVASCIFGLDKDRELKFTSLISIFNTDFRKLFLQGATITVKIYV